MRAQSLQHHARAQNAPIEALVTSTGPTYS